MDVATAGDDILFVVSRGDGGITTGGFGTDIYMRIGKTTIDEDHLGDFARGGFTWPVGIAVSNSGDVYCSDEYECNISAFRPDSVRTFPEYDPEGEYFSRWGTKGPKEGQLNGPTGIAFDTNDDLYVSDSLNHRIQTFSKNGDAVFRVYINPMVWIMWASGPLLFIGAILSIWPRKQNRRKKS